MGRHEGAGEELVLKKLLLVLQLYPGDRKMAFDLARLIADIEPKVSEHADFMLSLRRDTLDDIGAYHALQKKFEKVYLFHSQRKSTGWPAGCNDLFFESLSQVGKMVKAKRWDYDAALYFEADCVPLTKDWIRRLQAEWYAGHQQFVGNWISQLEFRIPHLNGNCLISTRITEKMPAFHACPPSQPWDIFHAKAIESRMRVTPLIYSDYKKTSITEAELYELKRRPSDHPLHGLEEQAVLYHGVKNNSAQIIVRDRLVNKHGPRPIEQDSVAAGI